MAKRPKKRPNRNTPPHLDILEDISALISHSHNLQETLERIAATVAERMQTEVCSIYILDRNTNRLTLRATMPAAPSSAFLPADKIDTPLDPNSMRDAGSALGCGVVRLIPEGTCIVEEVLKISEFFTAESCGQCPACRMETSTLTMMLKKVQAGQGGQPILEQFGKILAFNKGKGFCSLIGMPGPPIESALKLFSADFAAHLTTGNCPEN